MKWFANSLFLALILFSACGEDNPVPEVRPPANLQLEVNVSESNPALITIDASATNANFYRFFIASSDVVEQISGTLQHQFAASGDYEIKVQAHTTPSVYIEKSTTVTIYIPATADNGYTTPLTYDGYNLVWQDEFSGNELSNDWQHEIGTGSNGWGNNELQYYRQENTRVENDYLIIEARKENFGGRNYTSSRIVTMGKQAFQYGRIDIRAKLPEGQGIWPALWMLGSNFSTAGWPDCGEIDIMEMIGGQDRENTVHGTVHWDNNGQYANFGDSYSLAQGTFNDEFHVFSIIWDSQSIRWFVNDVQYNQIDITPATLSEFKQQFFFIFNIAVGGNWPGSPNSTTSFPQQIYVDYVRVFQTN